MSYIAIRSGLGNPLFLEKPLFDLGGFHSLHTKLQIGGYMDYYMGQIELFPYNFVPRNWLACEGQLLPVNQYSALFSLLGTQFGGNGTQNFGIPDLRNANANPNCKYFICIQGIYPSRS